MAANRPGDWHVLDLEKDPTPGDPLRVKALSRELQDFADDVSDALRLVKGMASEDAVLTWAGKSAKVFQEEFEDVPKSLKKLEKSYGMAGDALAAYWPKLERAQALADKALVNGREAQADLKSAASRLSDADSWVGRATKESEDFQKDKDKKDAPKPDEDKVRAATRNAQSAKSAQGTAKADVSSANSALDAAKKMAADARKMREDAAREAKDKLDEASDAGIKNRKWWEEVGDWVTDNWDTIVTVCKVIVAVVGIIAMIIGGPILAIIVVVAALVVLADTLNKYRKGEASLWDVAFAALDCIPGLKGLTTLGGLAKGLKSLAKGGLKGLANSVRGLAGSARSLLGKSKDALGRLKENIRKGLSDPIDMATGKMFLPQTDVLLPGSLPLAFTRRVESGYRTGWWFGPSWASTLDQHLEIDTEGVAFATEDGLVLAYPHPTVSEGFTLPEVGPRWPLARLEDGGYTVTDPAGGIVYRFGAPAGGVALPRQVSDRNGRHISFQFNEQGVPTDIRSSGGYHLKLAVEDGRVTELILADGGECGADATIKKYGYTDGNLTEVCNSSGHALHFTYDDRLRITSWTDSNESRYTYSYDDADRCIAEGGEGGHFALVLEYDGTDPEFPGMRVTTATTPEGYSSKHVVNDFCQVVAEVDPNGAVTQMAYDRYHRVVSRTDPLGNTTTIVNDTHGRPVKVIRPDGYETSVEYNKFGLPTLLFQEDGTVIGHTYDELGNHTSVTDAAGATTTYEYDGTGYLISATDAAGRTMRIRNNASGLPSETIDPAGRSTRYEYDAFGRVSAVTDPTGVRTRLTWTIDGQLLKRIGSAGSEESWTYDGEGNCLSHIDAQGRMSRYEYSHFDVVTAENRVDGTRYEFEHNSALQLTKVTNPQGLTWRYEYDPAGQVTAEVDFDGRRVAYEHDAAGRLSARINAEGQRVTYERDAFDWLVTKSVDGETTRYERDPLGRLLLAVSPSCEVSFRRDVLGRMTSEVVDGRVLSRTYDVVGCIARRTTPVGATTSYAYDAAGQISQMQTAGRTLDFGHNAAGREISREFLDSGLSLTRTWDQAGNMAELSLTGAAGVLVRRVYGYRADGHLTDIEDQSTGLRRFTLDSAGRVTTVNARGWQEAYAYDAAGNQTHAAWPAQHPSAEAQGDRVFDGNRLVRAGAVHYDYDAAGRITARRKTRLSRKPDIWRFSWDGEDRLTSVITPDGVTWRYRYDPFGRRTVKQRLAADHITVVEETRFTWDGSVLVEQISMAPQLLHQIATTWDHDGLHPVAQTDRKIASLGQQEIDCRFFAIVADLVGTPTELIDEEGGLSWHARSTLWGTTAWNRDATAYTPLRFPGQYFDPETGLHYNYQRHYDPETARYLTPDPLGLEPAPNPVAYVANPLQGCDPLGLAPRYANRPERYDWDGSVRYGGLDHLGRPTGISASIRGEMLREGTDAGSMWPRGWRGQGTLFNEGRGHLLANVLGGAGIGPNARHNLVTLTQNPTNHPHMYEMFEAPIARAVEGGQAVQYDVRAIYEGANPVPIRLEFSAFGNGDFSLSGFLDNPAAGVRTA